VLLFSLPAAVMSDVIQVAADLGMTSNSYMINDDDETVKAAFLNPATSTTNAFFRYRSARVCVFAGKLTTLSDSV
jgi:hypothetical protein